jgi:hypothetical protein
VPQRRACGARVLCRRVPSLAGELGRSTHWGVLWPAVAVTSLLSASRGRDPARSMLLTTIALPIILYSAVYHFSRWVSLDLHIQSSLHRLLLPSALVAVLYVATPLTGGWNTRDTRGVP